MSNLTTISTGGLDIPVIKMKGTPFECGRQYGAAIPDMIRKTVECYLAAFLYHNNLDKEEVFRLATRFLPLCEAFDETLVEEMRGIAEGANLPFEAIVAINARSELVFGMKANLDDGCTSFAAYGSATSDGRMLIGQNWDWKPSLRDSMVVLSIHRTGDPAVLTVSEAGLLGKFGFNDAGIGSVVNFLLSDSRKFGTPVHLIRRKVLRARTLEQAIETVVGAKRALSANYLLASETGQVVDIEARPDDVTMLYPQDDIIAHANHFQGDIGSAKDLGIDIFPDTLNRDVRLRELLVAKAGEISVPECQAALSDHDDHPNSICRHVDPSAKSDDQLETLGSIVIDLKSKTLYLTSGPPCETDYASVALHSDC